MQGFLARFAGYSRSALSTVLAITMVGTLLAIFQLAGTRAAPATAVISVTPSSGVVAVGNQLTVDVKIDTGGQAVSGVTVTLVNSANLSYVSSSTVGSVFDVEVSPVSHSTNTTTLSRTRFDEGYTGSNGQIVQLVYDVTTSGAGTLTFTVGSGETEAIAYSDSTDILSSVTNGSYTLGALPTVSSLGPSSLTDGSATSDTTPGAFTFTTTDADADQVQYQIQIDDSSNFASPVVDYTSALAAAGASSFTVGQAAGSGTYNTGSAATTLSDSSYYWRVRAIDVGGAASSYTTANSGSVAFMVDTTPPSAPTVSSPGSATITGASTYNITGTAVANSLVKVYTDPNNDGDPADGASAGTHQLSGGGTAFSVNVSLTTNTANNFVATAADAVGNESSATDVPSITYDAAGPATPSLSSPTDGSTTTDTTPTLAASAFSDTYSTHAVSEWQIATDSGFSSVVLDTGDDASNLTSYTLETSEALANSTTYYTRVRYKDSAGNYSSYSTTVSFTVSNTTPTITSLGPSGLTDGSSTTDTTPGPFTFTLGDADGDQVRYRIVIDDSADFATPIIDYTSTLQAAGAASFSFGASSGSYTAGSTSTTLSDGNYYWRARATDGSHNSAFLVANSGAVAFVVDTGLPSAPTVTVPSGAVVTGSTPYTMSGTAEANGLVQVYSDPNNDGDPADGSVVASEQLSGGDTTYSINLTLTANAANYFVVTVQDGASNESSATDVPTITYDATGPSTPNITAPTDSSTITDPTPTLAASAFSDTYSTHAASQWQLATDSGFTTGLLSTGDDTTNLTSYTTTALADATYYARVRYKDSAGNYSSYSSTISFTVANTIPTVSSLGSATLVDGTSSSDTTPGPFTFTLGDADGDQVRYRIQIDDSSDFASPVIDYSSALGVAGAASFSVGQAAGSGSYTAGSATTTLAGSDYYWRVRAIDMYGAVSAYTTANGGEVAFTVLAPLTFTSVGVTPSSSGATITWTTGTAASTQVEYGLTTSYGSATTETDTSTRVTSHSISITGLLPCTTYHYRPTGSNAIAESATGNDGTFTTSGCIGNAAVLSQASASITSGSGGSITHTGTYDDKGSFSLTIPTGYASGTHVFQIKQLETSTATTATEVPSGYQMVGNHFYQLSALSDTTTKTSTFTNPLTVIISYAASEIVGLDPASLTIRRWDESSSSWQEISNCTVDTNARTVTCTTNRFSAFALVGQAASSSTDSGTTSTTTTSASSASETTLPETGQNLLPLLVLAGLGWGVLIRFWRRVSN